MTIAVLTCVFAGVASLASCLGVFKIVFMAGELKQKVKDHDGRIGRLETWRDEFPITTH